MKRSALNIVLAAVVAALALALWLSREKEAPKAPLTDLVEADIAHIEIAHPDAPLIRLEKRGTDWRLVEPVDAPTDAFEVSSLLGLARLDVQRSLPSAEVDLAELKLDPPQYTVTLGERVLGFGDTEPIEYRRYIRVGDQVLLVADPPSAAIDSDYSDLVARNLLPRGAAIRRIEVPGLVVERAGDGRWQVEGQPDVGADRVQALVDAWKDVRAMWNGLRPEDAGETGDPVRIVLDDGELSLRVVQREPQLQIDNPAYGLRYTVSKAETEKLLALAPEPEPDAGTGEE